MIARVSVWAVDRFEQEVAKARDYSDYFEKGVACLDDFLRHLTYKKLSMESCQEKMYSAQWRLSISRNRLESEEAALLSEIESLLEHKNSLLNDEGSESDVAMFENRIDEAHKELFEVQSKIEHANNVGARISCHVDVLKRAQSRIEQNQTICRQLMEELEQIKNSNFCHGDAADEKLRRISTIVMNYRNVRISSIL